VLWKLDEAYKFLETRLTKCVYFTVIIAKLRIKRWTRYI